MKNILTIILLTINTTALAQDCLEADIVVLCDYSGSVKGYEGAILYTVKTLQEKFKYSGSARMSIVLFSSSRVTISGLKYSSEKGFSANLKKMDKYEAGNSTQMTYGIQEADSILYSTDRDVHKAMIIISDGRADNRPNALEIAQETKNKGTLIGTVFINQDQTSREAVEYGGIYKDFMQQLSTEGYYTESNYEGLAESIQELGICF